MAADILYMLGIVAVGFAVNFGLRALPFALFGGRNRTLPGWARSASAFASPVIIAGLIVYSYSTLAWKTPWPYLAGAVTVALHLVRRNPLVSIVAGTALYMCLLGCCGCATAETLVYDDIERPLVRISNNGILFRDRFVTPDEVPVLLAKHRVPKDAVVYVLVDDDYTDQRSLWVFKNNYLSRNGYTRSAWVHPRRVLSGSAAELPPQSLNVEIPYEGRMSRRNVK